MVKTSFLIFTVVFSVFNLLIVSRKIFSKGNFANVKELLSFWNFLISRIETVPGLNRCFFLFVSVSVSVKSSDFLTTFFFLFFFLRRE